MTTLEKVLEDALHEARLFLSTCNVLTDEQVEILKVNRLALKELKEENVLKGHRGELERVISEISSLINYHELSYG